MNHELWDRWAREANEAAWDRIREDAETAYTWLEVADVAALLVDSPCESPIERQLAAHLIPAAKRWGFTIVPQFKLGSYRYDFAIEKGGKTVALIECDGTEFHSTPEQIERDIAKDLLAERAGFAMFRFSGREIYRNARACAEEIIFGIWRQR